MKNRPLPSRCFTSWSIACGQTSIPLIDVETLMAGDGEFATQRVLRVGF